jgi:hypothetical protein
MFNPCTSRLRAAIFAGAETMRTISHPASSILYYKWDGGTEDEGQNELQGDNDRPPFDPDNPPVSPSWGHDPMTWLVTTSFAKGGKKTPAGAGRV